LFVFALLATISGSSPHTARVLDALETTTRVPLNDKARGFQKI
jgi:hypothetical protein